MSDSDISFLVFYIDMMDIGYMTIYPLICTVGFLISSVCFITLLISKLKEKTFFYLRIKSLLELFLLLFGILVPFLNCSSCNSKIHIITCIIIYKYLTNSFYLYATVIEIIIAANRHFILKSKKKNITKIKDKLFAFILFFSCLVVHVPNVFENNIVNSDEMNDSYRLEKSDFSKTDFFYYYIVCIGLVQNVLTVFLLIPINIMVVFEFKKFMTEKRKRLATESAKKNNHNEERKFNKMIIFHSLIFIYTRLIEGITEMFQIYFFIKPPSFMFNYYFYVLSIFVKYNTNFFFSMNFFIYYWFNQPFRDSFKKIFTVFKSCKCK